MEISNSFELVHNYYKRIFFLFVPNICNARCPFCYVEPTFSNQAILSNSLLNKTNSFVKSCKDIGFNEFRITGGEPLLFQNISELISIFQQNDVSYTLLTNGINLEKHFSSLTEYKPKKITISYHSRKYYEEIFGVKFNTDILDKNIKMICENKIDLTISILLLPENIHEIYTHINHLIGLGVKSIKLIYPNNESVKSKLLIEFNDTIKEINRIEGIEFRYSDLRRKTCNLLERGFLSLPLNQEKIFGCCNSVSNNEFISKFNSNILLTDILWDFYKSSRELTYFPCESHVDFCPIALNN